MKFEFEEDKKDTKYVKAVLYRFNGGPNLCLAIPDGNGGAGWFYHDTGYEHQKTKVDPNKEGVVKKFYSGDKITITF